MKYIKENLILFEIAVGFVLGGGYVLFNANSFENTTENYILGSIILLIGLIILWRSFIRKMINEKGEKDN